MTTHPWSEILFKVVDIPDVRYRVRHVRVPADPSTGEQYESKGGRTLVEIVRVQKQDDGYAKVEVLATGVARCHPRDNYNRKVGRDLALRAALRNYKAN